MAYFLSLNDLLSYNKYTTPKNLLSITNNNHWEWIDCKDEDGGRIIPSLNSERSSPYLYRGQVNRVIPCYPSIYRGLKINNNLKCQEEDTLKIIERRAKVFEFICILEKHPAIMYSKKIELHVDYKAISQHYGFDTEYLDLTDDIYVAAYFATHSYNGNKYKPIYEGDGVIYRVAWPLITMKDKFTNNSNHIEIIGRQVLKRPSNQGAWAYVMSMGYDFEKECKETLMFKRSKSEVERLDNIFKDGTYLFPNEDVCGLANRIKYSNTITKQSIEKALEEINDTTIKYKNIENYLNIKNIKIVENKTKLLSNKLRRKIKNTYSDEECSKVLINVGARLVFTK
jgi:hypothetical protein